MTPPRPPDLRAADVEHIELGVGESLRLESVRQAVVPPYVMLVPVIELPPHVVLVGQEGLDEDGVHGCIFTLQADRPGSGPLVVGFRDLRTGEIVRQKEITITTP